MLEEREGMEGLFLGVEFFDELEELDEMVERDVSEPTEDVECCARSCGGYSGSRGEGAGR